jgi:hypothetical protein
MRWSVRRIRKHLSARLIHSWQRRFLSAGAALLRVVQGIQNHFFAIALHYMHYNFCRIHKTLRVTPAMAAGVTDHFWDITDIADLIENEQPSTS